MTIFIPFLFRVVKVNSTVDPKIAILIPKEDNTTCYLLQRQNLFKILEVNKSPIRGSNHPPLSNGRGEGVYMTLPDLKSEG